MIEIGFQLREKRIVNTKEILDAYKGRTYEHIDIWQEWVSLGEYNKLKEQNKILKRKLKGVSL
jgi:hypothetical protein